MCGMYNEPNRYQGPPHLREPDQEYNDEDNCESCSQRQKIEYG